MPAAAVQGELSSHFSLQEALAPHISRLRASLINLPKSQQMPNFGSEIDHSRLMDSVS